MSWEKRDEVDEVWRAWGIRATEEDGREGIIDYMLCMHDHELYFSPLAVSVFGGSHAHHLASLGLWWLALLVAEAPDINQRLRGAWPLMTYCAGRGCLEAVKACLAAGAEVDAEGGNDDVG